MVYNELIIQNFIAAEDIDAGQIIAWPASNSKLNPVVEAATASKTQVIGVSAKDVKTGEPVTLLPLVPGKVYQLKAGGAVTAGVPLGVDASGYIVDAGAGTAALPMFSVESAAAAGDMFAGIVVHTNTAL